ncbi:MAG: hypothetical protein ACPGSG_10380, partial [Prolixibacteraceae bacterium]
MLKFNIKLLIATMGMLLVFSFPLCAAEFSPGVSTSSEESIEGGVQQHQEQSSIPQRSSSNYAANLLFLAAGFLLGLFASKPIGRKIKHYRKRNQPFCDTPYDRGSKTCLKGITRQESYNGTDGVFKDVNNDVNKKHPSFGKGSDLNSRYDSLNKQQRPSSLQDRSTLDQQNESREAKPLVNEFNNSVEDSQQLPKEDIPPKTEVEKKERREEWKKFYFENFEAGRFAIKHIKNKRSRWTCFSLSVKGDKGNFIPDECFNEISQQNPSGFYLPELFENLHECGNNYSKIRAFDEGEVR